MSILTSLVTSDAESTSYSTQDSSLNKLQQRGRFFWVVLILFVFALSRGVSAQTQTLVLADSGDSASAASLPDAPVPLGQAQATVIQEERAEPQAPEQQKQHSFGITPGFTTSYRADALPLSPSQKMKFAFRSSVDPVTFASAFVFAGYNELVGNYGEGYGWGASGYFKRVGASYLDSFDGIMIGSGVLPIVLHQDPRYFRLGHGTMTHRIFYAATTSSVICKGDRSRKWQPNVSNLGGNFISGVISNTYYPDHDTGWSLVASNALLLTAGSAAGGLFQEFWPDVSRKLFHKDPTHGLDAQAREQDRQKANKKTQPSESAPK